MPNMLLALIIVASATTEPPAESAAPSEGPAIERSRDGRGTTRERGATGRADDERESVKAAPPPVAFPHPLITEVLYAVPTKDGDANMDGTRQTSGDEFVELVNPHDREIKLGGYVLTDSSKPGKSQFRVVFPALTLKPGQVVVVFNGNEAEIPGSDRRLVGDTATPPRERHPAFGNAWVFTARAASSRTGFSNKGDYVLLSSPRGEAVQCVVWGEMEGPALPEGHRCLVERVPETGDGSVQRRSVDGAFDIHPPYRPEGLGIETKLMPFSPGVFVIPGLTRLEDLPPYQGER